MPFEPVVLAVHRPLEGALVREMLLKSSASPLPKALDTASFAHQIRVRRADDVPVWSNMDSSSADVNFRTNRSGKSRILSQSIPTGRREEAAQIMPFVWDNDRYRPGIFDTIG